MKNMDRLKIARYICIIITTVFMFFISYDNICIWEDEAFTLNAVGQSFPGLWQIIVDDLVHPPLYYFLLKLFLSFTDTNHLTQIPAAKMFSVLWIVLVLLWGSKLIEKRYGSRTALLFTVFMCGTETVGFSTEIRMYSMPLCFTCLAYLYANEVRYKNDRKSWILFTLFTVLGALSHYFSLISLSFVWLWMMYVCIRQKTLRKYLYALAVCAASYLPWIITVLTHMKSVTDYSTKITFVRVVQFFAFPFSCHNDILSAVLLGLSVLIFIRIVTLSRDAFPYVCIFNILYTGAVCIGLSVLFDKFFIGRYLLPGWGAFWAGMAIGMKDEKRFLLPLTVLISVIDLMAMYFIGTVELQDDRDTRYMMSLLKSIPMPVYADNEIVSTVNYLMPDLHAEQIQSCENRGYYLVHLNSRWDQDLEACYYETIGLSANDITVYIKD